MHTGDGINAAGRSRIGPVPNSASLEAEDDVLQFWQVVGTLADQKVFNVTVGAKVVVNDTISMSKAMFAMWFSVGEDGIHLREDLLRHYCHKTISEGPPPPPPDRPSTYELVIAKSLMMEFSTRGILFDGQLLVWGVLARFIYISDTGIRLVNDQAVVAHLQHEALVAKYNLIKEFFSR